MTLSRITLLAATIALTATVAKAQMSGMPGMAPAPTDHGKSVDGKPLVSPAATADVMLGDKSIKITYNTPSMRGRKIMGGLVPYGKVWRTGANPATSFTTDTDLKIGTLSVPAGSYTLYTIPAEAPSSWILIINKQTGQWGTVYDEKQDLGRTEMKFSKIPTPQELMSLSFEKTKAKSTELHMRWETTDAWVKIEAAK